MRRPSITIIAAALLSACTQSAPPPAARPGAEPAARAAQAGPCADGFVEIAVGSPACGIALGADGSLSVDGRRTAPIVASYQESATGQVAMPARQIILFPAAPQSGLRILQACDGVDANALCWSVRLLDPETAGLSAIAAGKYGPHHWISWSPQEHRVALISSTEGFDWLHVIETDDGPTRIFPNADENANWKINRMTFTWHGDDAFSVEVKECESCAPVERSFNLP